MSFLSLETNHVSLWWADKSMNSFPEKVIISEKEMIIPLQKKKKKKCSNDWLCHTYRVCLTAIQVGARDGFLGLWGTLAPSSIKKNIKNYILWLPWYKEKYNPGWVRYYIFTIFLFILGERIKIKTFSWATKSIMAPGTVCNG